MARKQSPSVRTTLYRLVDVPILLDGVRSKYTDENSDFSWQYVIVNDREALLVTGVMVTQLVRWADTLQQLTDHTVEIGNRIAAAALLIRNGDDAAWALTYGMGFHLLEQAKVDPGFGQRIAIRTVDPNELNSLTRTTLDYRSRTDRLSIPSGEHLRGFGVSDFGELVTRLVAKAKIEGLTAGANPLVIRGADALNMPLGRRPDALLADLDLIDSILNLQAPAELEVLEQLVAIKNQTKLKDRLESQLARKLAGHDIGRLALSWPHEQIDENGTPSSYRLISAGREHGFVQDGIPDLDSLLAPLGGLDPEDRLAKLDRMRIVLFRDAEGEEAITSAIAARKWLAFETYEDGRCYCLHGGSWYLMASNYAEKLSRRVQEIFERDPGISLPDWPADGDEDEAMYNTRAAQSLGGTLMDQKLIHTGLHRHGIEACDILLSEGELVHVKDIDKSAPASHLLAQALVSADALLHDEEARDEFRAIVERSRGDVSEMTTPIRSVILGVARKARPISAEDLFTFTKVNLVRHVASLEERGVQVFVVPIMRP
ncbi:sporadically distributed protein, TIGR04141 family [Haloechinothrix alba]|uniref:Sporadically distributed protein, TIGR04141 family n=1 Tax=Haloechinothrix alba TaxID=664784 RepID=A0A238YAD6_9PSEU|nr:DUF6119 family protein [Haloechinothrix alba]SNR67990.1 sporadically distributed protein, TIGR04141 family [Haloechinothrix alba]